MIWHNISASAARVSVHELEQCFWDLGAVSVTVVDGADDPLYEPGPGETPLWQTACVTGLFEDDIELDNVKGQLADAGFRVVDDQLVHDRLWEREWLKHFKPMRFGSRLWVCPSEMSISEPDAVVVKLDPGLAFGTGTHATTSLCLQWLDAHNVQGRRILDFGCGSGILAIAACLLGASGVTAVDNDPQALSSTEDNARKNSVQMTIASELEAQRYDAVIANILAQPLIDLNGLLINAVVPAGDLVLSGILESQQEWVLNAYPTLQLVSTQSLNGWCRLHLRKTSE